MAVELRPLSAVLVLVVLLLLGTAGSIAIAEPGGVEYGATTESVTLAGTERDLWLYTTPTQSLEQPTLAINVIVYADPESVRQLLLQEGNGNWNETDTDEQGIAPDEHPETTAPTESTTTEWTVADGSRRYVYISGTAGGTWLSETFQVHDGDYLGSRHHVRAYAKPDTDTNWTAMQAHREHWDWFSGRHVVTSTDETQAYVEREFADEPDTSEITRVPVGEGEQTDFDQWLTIVDFQDRGLESMPGRMPGFAVGSVLFLALVVLGTFGSRVADTATALRREFPEKDERTLLLAVTLVALLVSVRLGGIAIERSLDVPPKPVAIALYPVILAGIPIVTHLLARPLDRPRAFAGATLGFLTALLVDYTYLGVTHLPLDLLVHRGTLAVALGLIAVGSSRVGREEADRLRQPRLGVLLWLVAMIAPLLRHTPLPM